MSRRLVTPAVCQSTARSGTRLALVGGEQTADSVTELLGRLDEFKAHVRRVENRAVFEVPEMLAGVLDGALRVGPRCVLAAERV